MCNVMVRDRDIKKFAKTAANLLAGEVSRILNEKGLEIDQTKITPRHMVDIVDALEDGKVSFNGAKIIINETMQTGKAVEVVIEELGLKQISDLTVLGSIVDKIIQAFPTQVAEYRSGKDKMIGFFIGKAMKASDGKANPGVLQELVKSKLLGEV